MNLLYNATLEVVPSWETSTPKKVCDFDGAILQIIKDHNFHNMEHDMLSSAKTSCCKMGRKSGCFRH